MTEKELDLYESEWTILEAVWELQPCAAPAVQEHLSKSKNWAYTTVKTMMDRMVKKGLLTTEKIRNLYLYSTDITRQQAKASEISRTLKRAFGGSLTPMMQFLLDNDQMSSDEFDQLEALIKQKKDIKGK